MRTRPRFAALAAATALTLGGTAAVATSATAAAPNGQARGYTSVTLTADAAAAILGPLGGGVLKPGAVDLSAGSVGFPIVGNSKGGVIKHTGGLSFSGENVVEIRNFWIDTSKIGMADTLTADVYVNGDYVARAPIFNVSGALQVSLSHFAAGALSELVLGDPDAIPGGFVIGTAAVNPR
jgi:hypothetical protein